MKSFGNSVKLLTFALISIFLLNMLIMYVFFDTDVFNPGGGEELEINITELHSDPEDTLDPDEVPEAAYQDSTTGAAMDYFQEETNEATPEEHDIHAAIKAEIPDSTYFMTRGEVGFLESLNMLDKLEALSLISKVGREEADKIYDLAMDGITYIEMKEIEAILTKNLDQEEMDKLTGLLEKNKKQYSVKKE